MPLSEIWGPLTKQLVDTRETLNQVEMLKRVINKFKSEITKNLKDLNVSRRAYVSCLLDEEKKAICLTHHIVFPQSEIIEWVANDVSIVLLKQVYRGETWEKPSCFSSFESASCPACLAILRKDFVYSSEMFRTELDETRIPSSTFFYELLGYEGALDKVSEAKYHMPKLTADNILLL